MKLERPGYDKFIQTEKEQKLEDRKILLDAKKKKALLDAKLISSIVVGETYYSGTLKQNITITKKGSGRDTQGSGTSYWDYFTYAQEDGKHGRKQYQVKESEIIKQFELSKAKAVDQKRIDVKVANDKKKCAWLTTNSGISTMSVDILKQVKVIYVGNAKATSFKLCVTAYTELIAAEGHRKAFYDIDDREGASMTQLLTSLKTANKALKELGRYISIKGTLSTILTKLIRLQDTNIDGSYDLWDDAVYALKESLFKYYMPKAYDAKEIRKSK